MDQSATPHPAKVKIRLAEHIYKHAFEEGWIERGGIVLDPFCGVCGFGMHALLNGLVFCGVELEPRFVEEANKNIELWIKKFAGMPHLGTVLVLQGDSRKLKEVLGGWELHNLLCSSLPFQGQFPCQADDYEGFEHVGTVKQGAIGGKYADDTEGNLSGMPAGGLICSSPPYIDSLKGNIETIDENRLDRMREAGFVERSSHGFLRSVQSKSICANYGETEGNLGNLPEGDLCISSPPYTESLASDDPDKRKGLFCDPKRHNDPTLTATYGDTVGQLGAMKVGGEDVNKLTSSPPYENMVNASGEGPGATHYSDSDAPSAQSCGVGYSKDNQDNLGNESGETFWGAAKLIVGQCFEVLRPGAHAIFVVKDYVKSGKIVTFSQNCANLCEQCGFVLIHWHRAWLTEDRGSHFILDGGVVHKKVKHSSFFRILAEKRGAPPIDFESVLCFVKPVK